MQYLNALPPYPGGKRRLLPAIFGILNSVAPRASWPSLSFADAFLGGGAVGLTAKALCFRRVIANDLAERACIVGRALLVNSSVCLLPADVLRLFAEPPVVNSEPPQVLRRLAPSSRSFFERAWCHLRAGSFSGVQQDLVSLLVIKLLLRSFPMSLPTASDAHRVGGGDFDRVTPPRLTHYLRAAARVVQPRTLLCTADAINAAVLPGEAELHQGDVFEFLTAVEADVVYLDAPYGSTQAYERAFALLDEFLAVEPLAASRFSSRQPPLDDLIDSCSHIPTLILSLNNALLDETEIMALVKRHRTVRQVVSLPYRHYGSVATASKNATNREVLVLGVR